MLSHLADVSIRSVILALIAALAVWRRTPAVQHAIWAMVAGGMLLLGALGSDLPRLPVRVLEAAPEPDLPAVSPAFHLPVQHLEETGPVVVTETQRAPGIGWRDLLTYSYEAIALALLARFLLGALLLRRLIRRSRPCGPFCESGRIAVPLTVGWFRPIVLLPPEWREWDGAKLRAVLAHESAHARRRDGLIAALAGINRCIFWLHPLAWWLERRLALLSELACDEASVAVTGDREAYARLLVEMAQVVDGSRGRLRAHALSMAARSHIGRRIESLLGQRPTSKSLTVAGRAVIAACAIPIVWGAGAVEVNHRAPLLRLAPLPLHAPQPPELLAQAGPASVPAPAAQASKPHAPARFEVASVRAAAPNPNTRRCFGSGRFSMDAGRVSFRCFSLQGLMEIAFGLPQKQVDGPDWLHYHAGPQFDISATLPPGATADQIPEMLQALLVERFKLLYRVEHKEQNVDTLVVAKGGLKLKEASSRAAANVQDQSGGPISLQTLNGRPTKMTPLAGGRGSSQSNARFDDYRETMPSPGTIRWEFSGSTTQGIADAMADRLKRPIIDMTGLQGRYDLTLEVKTVQFDFNALAAASDKSLGDVNREIDAQLTELRNHFNAELQKSGLELEMRKAPVETVVAEHIEQTPTDN